MRAISVVAREIKPQVLGILPSLWYLQRERKDPSAHFGWSLLPASLAWLLSGLPTVGVQQLDLPFSRAILSCPEKKRQIKNLQGPLHHWPVTGALGELIFHGSICLGAKILIKMYFVHVKKDCCFQIYLTSIKLCLLLGSCVSRWHSSWDTGQELLFFEDYLHLGSGL